MKQTTAAGIVGAMVMLLVGVILEGGNPMAFINIPAFVIVVGGTCMAMLASSSMEEAMSVPKLAVLAMTGGQSVDRPAAAKQMVSLAEKARREGLLALEAQLEEVEDPFTKKGVGLIVDGTDSTVVETILRSEIDGMAGRHAKNAKLFSTLGGFAPTLGILGTVLSLVHVLENLSDPGSLGHSIAGAFIATLYGVGSANVFYFPIANRLKELSGDEVHYREMVMDAILAIQAGENPRLLGERLETYLPPAERGAAAEQAPASEPAPVEDEMAEAA
jgi:chemotaxis protein MotA